MAASMRGLIQNRSFEYNPGDRKEWNPFTANTGAGSMITKDIS